MFDVVVVILLMLLVVGHCCKFAVSKVYLFNEAIPISDVTFGIQGGSGYFFRNVVGDTGKTRHWESSLELRKAEDDVKSHWGMEGILNSDDARPSDIRIEMEWLEAIYYSDFLGQHVCIFPLWPLTTLALITTAYRSRRRIKQHFRNRRIRRGLCVGCGYSLRGSTHATEKCPECGVDMPHSPLSISR